jgi:tryptophanyl-tRNA synthetase
MRIVTDTTDIDDPKNKDTPLFHLYSLFLDEREQKRLADRYEGKGLRYGDVKQEFYEKVLDVFGPFREKRENLISNPKQVHEILDAGAKKARQVAEEVLDRVRSASGVNYN